VTRALELDSWTEDADEDRVMETPDRVMVTPVTLRYPNGRCHETTLNRELLPGEQFVMFGRTWTALLKDRRRRPRQADIGRVVCVPAESDTPA
jgi:hypothetical protein